MEIVPDPRDKVPEPEELLVFARDMIHRAILTITAMPWEEALAAAKEAGEVAGGAWDTDMATTPVMSDLMSQMRSFINNMSVKKMRSNG
jgi:hypothetical protein